jgi:predicted nucleotidyltransferase
MEQRWRTVVDALVRELATMPEVERVVLFGSRARGDNRERSNIDLAVAAPVASVLAWDRVQELAEEAPTLLSVDVVRLDWVGRALRDVIEDEGIVLFERPHAA